MKRYLFIFGLFLGYSMGAHATACSGGAHCVSVQSVEWSGGSPASIAFSPDNTSGNTLDAFVFLSCATAWGNYSTMQFQDANANSYDYNWMSEFDSTATGFQQTFFAWTYKPIATGANTLNMTIIGHSDCHALAFVWEHANVYLRYTFGTDIFLNATSSGSFGNGTTTFPKSTAGGGSSPDTALVIAAHDTGNTGTFGISDSQGGSYNLNSIFSGSANSQIAAWDQVSTEPPATITVTNTGGTGYDTAHVNFLVFNNTPPSGPPPPPTTPTLMNYNSGACANLFAGETSTTCTFVNVLNPDVGIIMAWGFTGGAPNIQSVSGCGNSNWTRVYLGDFDGSEQDMFVSTYLTPGSSCAVTVTFNGAQTGTLVAQAEYAGVAASPIAYLPAGGGDSVRIPSQVGGAAVPFQTYEANDLVVMIGSSSNNCGGNFYVSAGTPLTLHNPIRANYPCPPTPSGGNRALIQFMDATIATPGTYSSTVVNNQGADSYIFPLVLRANMPTGPAVLQSITCSSNNLTGNTVLGCDPVVPRLSTGTRWLVISETRNLDNVLADSLGNCAGKNLPSYWGNATVGQAQFCDDTSLGRPHFSVTSASDQQTDIIIEEVQDVDTVFPLYAGQAWTNDYASNVGPNVTTQDNGPMPVPGGQCYLLTGFNGGGNTNLLFTASSGFNLRGTPAWNYGYTLGTTWDQQVCPGSNTTYDFTITSPIAQGGLETGMWALGATQNTSFPVVAQTLPAQFIASSAAAPFVGPVSAGDVITVCAIGNSASALTISSTPTLTWHLGASGGPSDIYSAWYATKPSTGSLSVQVSGTFGAGGFIDTVLLDNRFITAFDAVNSGYAGTSGNLSTGNISTTANHDWLVSCALSVDDTTASFALPTNDLWSLNQYYPTDGGYSDSWTMVAGAPGSYSNTFDFIQNQPNAAVIFGFTTSIPTPPSTVVQPNVTVLGMNKVDNDIFQSFVQYATR